VEKRLDLLVGHVRPQDTQQDCVEIPHRLGEIPQRLLLDHHRPRREPDVLRTGFSEHPSLLHVSRQRADRSVLLVDVLAAVPVHPAERLP
jgi:hypothetical protein